MGMYQEMHKMLHGIGGSAVLEFDSFHSLGFFASGFQV